jgi:hypothetical protein
VKKDKRRIRMKEINIRKSLRGDKIRIKNKTGKTLSIFPSTLNPDFVIKIPPKQVIFIINLTREEQTIIFNPLDLKNLITLSPGRSHIYVDGSFLEIEPEKADAYQRFFFDDQNIFWVVPQDVNQRLLYGSDRRNFFVASNIC